MAIAEISFDAVHRGDDPPLGEIVIGPECKAQGRFAITNCPG